tara:strand:+ start:83 stop:301 length:219 start_codon:yes stop_codon:yes gene_type:complete
MHFKYLENIFNKKVRENCEKYEKIYFDCLKNNFDKKEYCQSEFHDLKLCVHQFCKEWKKKYKNYNLKIEEKI